MTIIPLILSGGAGTRLWPLSRRSRPKQFLRLESEYTLFQEAILRCSDDLFDSRPIVVAANEHRFLVAENLQELGVEADILLEPTSQNSCAAIVAGCLKAVERDPNAIVLVLAADHRIKDIPGFTATIRSAEAACRTGHLVTFGVKPEYPATGYGYILVDDIPLSGDEAVFPVTRFIEKPDENSAAGYVSKGYLWNSGNFVFMAKTFLEEARDIVEGVYTPVLSAYSNRVRDLDFERLSETHFSQATPISVDYAVMEKTAKAVVVPCRHDWSDIGTWHSVWQHLQKTEDNNAIVGDGLVESGEGNLVHSQDRLTALVGVDDLVVVSTEDVVLVAPLGDADAIKSLVGKLADLERDEACMGRKTYRPWGSYEVIDQGSNYKVKRIEIKPGAALSLQTHRFRSEHWVVVKGTPDIVIGAENRRLEANQSVYIPAGEVHRLSNSTSEPAILIEVQTGSLLSEDDIERLEDQYNREQFDEKNS